MDPELLRVVAGKLEILHEWYAKWKDPTLYQHYVRESTNALRELFGSKRLLETAWRMMGFEGSPRFVASTIEGDTSKVLLQVAGTAAIQAPPNEGPPPPSAKELKLKDYVEKPFLVVKGISFSRNDVIEYVANKLGGVHFGRKDRETLLDNPPVGGLQPMNIIFFALLSIGQDLIRSSDIQKLRQKLDSIVGVENSHR